MTILSLKDEQTESERHATWRGMVIEALKNLDAAIEKTASQENVMLLREQFDNCVLKCSRLFEKENDSVKHLEEVKVDMHLFRECREEIRARLSALESDKLDKIEVKKALKELYEAVSKLEMKISNAGIKLVYLGLSGGAGTTLIWFLLRHIWKINVPGGTN